MGNTNGKINQHTYNGQSEFPNPLEIWKQMYYLTEKSWSKTVNSIISTDSASKSLVQFMNLYLDYEKIFRKGMDQYFEAAPVPSKKDIARVAKLVIGVEDKVDDLESNIEKNMTRLVSNLALLVDNLELKQDRNTVKELELEQIREAIESINQKLSGLTEKMDGLSVVQNDSTNRTQGKPGKKLKGGATLAEEKVNDFSQEQ
ncbi:hypothetical protein [Desulfoscipio gibsoniae]|uniref:Poly(3-hydroxyalkanoate) polymerase subunit PhaE n=1 Tax=Desulfoscipio gibsoniae DSM 7213 TaxID=767817 RepID=R4KMY0_9FIRM|nr:hypothetical protein [Desulfoscipio gibsoniae]AGL02932.1 hypothetical protein Desgi_3609 [Desulfoscipio gibsoniae DSM 7213]